MTQQDKVVTAGIDHLHLNVYAIDQAIQLFTDLFACKHNVPLYIDSVDATNSMNSLGMDVMSPASEDGLYGRMMQRLGEGISAVSFYVDDLDDATAKIEATGLRKVSEIGYPEIERQTQFHAKDFFGMSLELVYLYPGAQEKMAAMQSAQAKDNHGKSHIEAGPDAVPTGGIHHVRLKVKSVEDLEAAIDKFERGFECQWERAADGRSATSSLDVHLWVSEDGTQGIDAFGMAVPNLQEAKRRVEALGLTLAETPQYLAAKERALCLAPSECFGVSVVLVESEMQREHRHH